MSTLTPAALRALAISAAFAIYQTVFSLLDSGEGGANIGAGLAAFAGMLLVSGVWGIADGLRTRLRSGEATWALAGLLTGLVLGVVLAVRGADGSMRLDELAGAVLGVSVFLVGLVAVPGVLGHLIGSSLRRGRPQPGPGDTQPAG